MATTTRIERLDSLVAEVATRLHMPSPPPTPSASSSSPSSYFQIQEQVERLRRTMMRIRALLIDAEEMEIRDETIQLWLDELRDVAYDAEDMVEEFDYELQRHDQLVGEEDEVNADTTHVDNEGISIMRERQAGDSRNITPPSPVLHDATFQHQILAKISKINDRFDEIYGDKRALKLSKKEGDKHREQMMVQRLPTSSLLDSSSVYGRFFDQKWVVEMLLPSRSQHRAHLSTDQNVSSVSIIGMGGIGKTTLAQLVYDDDKVKKYFKQRAWVCVSECLDVVKLTKEILEAFTRETVNLEGFNQHQEKLREHLKETRFLLVLDDLWNENWEHWESLWKPLSHGAEGSMVLITTRNEKVSNTSHAVRTHHLRALPDDACWSLFAQCAFRCENPSDDHITSIGKQIVKKCGGVPLAVRTLGALLCNETGEDRWNDVLNSDIWELARKGNYILPALKISYHHLPSPIKPCFAVCAVFPKDYLFEREDLIFFWMAQGYITAGGRKSMKDVGQDYFDELLQRSFLQYGTGDSLFDLYQSRTCFKMHDLIHDLALSIWGSECLTVEDGKKLPSNAVSSRKHRHLSFKGESDIVSLIHRSDDTFNYSRTSYLIRSKLKDESPFPGRVLDDMFNRMKYLRVLHLNNFPISELPDSIGNLKHLRYLSICMGSGFSSHRFPCFISYRRYRLPESLGNLLNLQTLQVRKYNGTIELPNGLKYLVNLRHLDVESPVVLPRDVGRLTQVQTMPGVVMGLGAHSAGIEELTHLNDLQGELTVDVRSINDWVVNREPNILSNKKGLKLLHLVLDYFYGKYDDESAGIDSTQQQQEQLLELIQPHTNIKQLNISGCFDNRLPKWMGDPSYSRLERISLSFRSAKLLWNPALGQPPSLSLGSIGQLPSLKHLYVGGCTDAARISNCEFLIDGSSMMVVDGASPFPSLETLSLGYLPEVEEIWWIGRDDGGTCPRLRKLVIDRCSNLRYVKLRHLTALRVLSVRECNKLTTLDYYDEKPQQREEEEDAAVDQYHTHMHVPRVHSMCLEACSALDFHLTSAQQQLPSSLRCLRIRGSPLVSEWVIRHMDEMPGVANIRSDDHDHHLLSKTKVRPRLVLQNIDDEEEAKAAELHYASPTRRLELRWDLDRHHWPSTSTPEEAERILNAIVGFTLSDQELLEELVIEGYRGRSFPYWVSCPFYLKSLVKLTLAGCIHCERLPPLGGLWSLRELHISNMCKVEHVGREFRVSEKSKPGCEDPFDELPVPEQWELCQEHSFPKLRVLTLGNFPMLRTLQFLATSSGTSHPLFSPTSLPRLEKFLIEDCPELVSLTGLDGISSMRSLSLRGCPSLDFSNEARLPPRLSYAEITGCPLLSRWCLGHGLISRISELWVDGELVLSGGTSPEEVSDGMSIEEDTDGTTNEDDNDGASTEHNTNRTSIEEDSCGMSIEEE